MLAFSIGIGCMLLSSPAWARVPDYKTTVHFDKPVEVPGSDPQVLAPGTYVFKIFDSKVNRNIVQVSDKEGNHIYTTILTVPMHRDIATEKTVMIFEEREAGQPPAVRAWFYPFEKEGHEFVYSKSRAVELAKSSNSPVPYSENVASTPLPVPVAAAIPVAATTAAPIERILPNGQSEPYTQQAQAETQTPSQVPARNATLPATASNLPLYGLVGCLSVIAGFSVRVLCGR